ncbi:hypothetical protein WR25_20361 [Diploscapter pachys]|uniref:Uncharacterized protein n=1 Tax=Diploscapter pachys TaxID=2018661 RepID=A0A2A2KF04_9BILA|nr:hypothetical protein WR25_20361 [Diploscapter pachys]
MPSQARQALRQAKHQMKAMRTTPTARQPSGQAPPVGAAFKPALSRWPAPRSDHLVRYVGRSVPAPGHPYRPGTSRNSS